MQGPPYRPTATALPPYRPYRLPLHMHPSRDHHLPPDPDAYRHAPHPKGRIIVIAPTRAACETIELALGLQVETLLEREHGDELRQWAAAGKGFGIVAGTGTGKTLGIRPIAESILREPLLGRSGQPGAGSDAGDAHAGTWSS